MQPRLCEAIGCWGPPGQHLPSPSQSLNLLGIMPRLPMGGAAVGPILQMMAPRQRSQVTCLRLHSW